jgi:signal transduction histidine kinase
LCSGLLASLFISIATPVSAVQTLSFVLLAFWLLLSWLFWRGLTLPFTCQAASFLGAVQLFVIAWFSGGVYASCLMWFSVLIVANYFIVGRMAAFFWLLIDVGVHYIQAYAFDWWGFGPVLGLGSQNALASLIDYSFSFIIIIAILLFYHSQYDQAVNDLEKKQGDLKNTEQELSQTLQMRESFIGSVSHELRTPMNAIMGFNSLLLSMVRDKPRALMVLDHTRQSADHLLTVINDVLDYTQFKSGQLCSDWVQQGIINNWVERGYELALGLTPCDLWPLIQGRTLFLMGDSMMLDFYKASLGRAGLGRGHAILRHSNKSMKQVLKHLLDVSTTVLNVH